MTRSQRGITHNFKLQNKDQQQTANMNYHDSPNTIDNVIRGSASKLSIENIYISVDLSMSNTH